MNKISIAPHKSEIIFMMSIIIYFLVFRKINVLILIIFCQSSVLKWQNYTILFKKYTILSLTEKRFFEKIFVLRLKINKFSVIIFRIPQKKYFFKGRYLQTSGFSCRLRKLFYQALTVRFTLMTFCSLSLSTV